MIGRTLLRLMLVAACCLPEAAVAASWWNGDWGFRKEIAVDLSPKGADVAGTVQDAPVLLRFSVANFSYFADVKPDGSDLRLIGADDKTPLKFHLERFDAQSQLAFVWVRVPRLTGGAATDKFYMYYGNASAPNAGDATGTYDNDQVVVLHFSEPSGKPSDSTAYKNDAAESTAELTAASLIGGGLKFSGAQLVTIPASGTLRLLPTQGLTATAWVKLDAPQRAATVVALTDGSKQLAINLDGMRPAARYAGDGAPVSVVGASDLTPGWHHLGVTLGAAQLTLYVDGVPAGSSAARPVEIGGAFTIGGVAGGSFFSGEIDEVGVAKVARSADWIRVAARSQGVDAPLVAYGADGQKEAGQGSYIGTILRNLTIDGWVIIVICMLMLIVALIIMVMKALYLGRVEKANRAFLRRYEETRGDSRALDHQVSGEEQEFAERSPIMAALSHEGGEYGASTLFGIYHAGVREINKRLGAPSVGAARVRVLSPASVEAIRAALDATATRLQQRLSARMVLLTIAISGGPFLGLLGTVIGVMITFAAIAASGDVNVNAIAPGTAAALAATVAGLTVAIPCLFGYNWLNSRIKAIAADNRVFLDEFIARAAEQYSEV